MNRIQTLVSTRWLHECILNPHGSSPLRILDASWYLPRDKRDTKQEYEDKHIPGALFFDIDACSDQTSNYGHMLPRAADFETYVGNLGIDNKTHVVIYDTSKNGGFFSAQRVWWTFRVFGHNLVSLLDGGFIKWCSEGLPVSTEKLQVPQTTFKADYQSHMVKAFEDIERNLQNGTFQLADARGAGRFDGVLPEPRDGIKPGHIRNAVNIPYTTLVDQENMKFKNPEELRKIFSDANIDMSKPMVATCGSGVTACCIALAAHLCDKDVPVYDGSWTEWYLRSTPEQRSNCPDD